MARIILVVAVLALVVAAFSLGFTMGRSDGGNSGHTDPCAGLTGSARTWCQTH